MNGYADLDRIVARVRELGALADDVAHEAVPDLQSAARETAAAGTAPDGEKWAPTKSGAAPLQHAADAITARALGTVVQIVVSGYHAVHNRGTKRLPARPIIPSTITPRISSALHEAAARVFERVTRGA